MKYLTKLLTLILTVIVSLLVLILTDDQEVLIESAESKTPANGPVYNKIKWYSYKNKDIWMMNQSHFGKDATVKNWERLAIIIDKTTNPKTAKFMQLGPGGLEWKDSIPKRPFKVACYMCHSNGPRIIRPNLTSSLSELSLWNKAKITYWNFQIKMYGRVVPHPDHTVEDQNLKMPFRWKSAFENEPLKVKPCTYCHKESGFLARGTLKRQHLPTIKFMLHQGHMPPFGFSISEAEKRQLNRFMGFFSIKTQ